MATINLKYRREATYRGKPGEVLAAKHGFVEVEAYVSEQVLMEAYYKQPHEKNWSRVRTAGPFWRDLETAVASFNRERAGLIESLV